MFCAQANRGCRPEAYALHDLLPNLELSHTATSEYTMSVKPNNEDREQAQSQTIRFALICNSLIFSLLCAIVGLPKAPTVSTCDGTVSRVAAARSGFSDEESPKGLHARHLINALSHPGTQRNLILLEFPVERCPAYAEHLAGQRFVSARLLKNAQDSHALHVGKGRGCERVLMFGGPRRFLTGKNRRRQIFDVNRAPISQRKSPGNRIFQLADIARPIVL